MQQKIKCIEVVYSDKHEIFKKKKLYNLSFSKKSKSKLKFKFKNTFFHEIRLSSYLNFSRHAFSSAKVEVEF